MRRCGLPQGLGASGCWCYEVAVRIMAILTALLPSGANDFLWYRKRNWRG